MLNMVGGLARTLYIILAIVAGFVALGGMDMALILVVLGLISGISLPVERYVTAAVTVIALPFLGAALGHIPAIGAQLGAARQVWVEIRQVDPMLDQLDVIGAASVELDKRIPHLG